MNHILAAASTTSSLAGFFHGLAHAFDELRHLVAQIGRVGLPVIIIIAILIHLALARRGGVFTLHHHLETLILGVGLVVVFPVIAKWLGGLTEGGRGGFDAVVLITAFSDLIFSFGKRFIPQQREE